MAAPTAASPLAQAWAYHRSGRNDAALTEFERILKGDSDHIDALFGLGLTQRSLGQSDNAIATFKKVLELVEQELEKTPGEDRWEMLERMCYQRISETERQKAS